MQKEATRGKIALYEVLIFATGAVTLSLEVLASRHGTLFGGIFSQPDPCKLFEDLAYRFQYRL